MNLLAAFEKKYARYWEWESLVSYSIVLIKIVAIILVAYLALKLLDRLINRLLKVEEAPNPRLMTLSRLLQSVALYVVCFIVGVMILEELGIRTTSLVAGAGIVGLVVGLGAQNLIKDIISGFFIIVEDQYMVGDYIEVGSLQGKVTVIGLRATRLTDWGGEIHVIPNGQITQVTNHSRAIRRATVDVRIVYHEDTEKVMQILNRIAEEAALEFDYIKEGPTVLGIVEFGETSILIRIIAMTEPMRQWELERELRARIKQQFDLEGISLPVFPGLQGVKGVSDGTQKI